MSDSEMAAPVESAEEQEQKRLKLNAVNKAKAESVQKEFEGRFLSSSLSTTQMFLGDYGKATPIHVPSRTVLLSTKVADEYESVKNGVAGFAAKDAATAGKEAAEIDAKASAEKESLMASKEEKGDEITTESIVDSLPEKKQDAADSSNGALITWQKLQTLPEHLQAHQQLILRQRQRASVRPVWHAPWKLMRVISGHLGWVRCAAVDPANEWFVTGSNDRTIKIWDLASGVLKLTLTGHISIVRALCVSNRHPYLFSTGDDKTVKCWDLEYNKVVRHYHGHLSGVYSMAMHPTLDILMTGGRDSACRVWDIRTKAQVMVLGGHSSTVASIETQACDPQVVTGSHDSTIRLWDLVAGKSSSILTNHKKSVRALQMHPTEFTFASASADNMKVWKFPKGEFLRNVSGHNTIVNTMALNHDNVMVSGGDNGSMKFWDWKSGYNFQSMQTTVQPGSMDSEAGIMQMKFDMTGSRLITCESDKTIKIYKEDPMATEETHPIDWRPSKKRARY